jgi:hypothetical protein
MTASADPGAATQDVTGFVTLTLGPIVRRIPYWLAVATPRLPQEPFTTLVKPGIYSGQTRGKAARVTAYRYPMAPHGPVSFPGPEQVFQVTLKQRVVNFGVRITRETKAGSVSPRIVFDRDENRLAGDTALPLAINPYLDSFGTPAPEAGVIRPAPGSYGIVFDTPAGASPGAFSFRFWINDVTPPSVRLLTPTVGRHSSLELAVADAGSGLDPQSLQATVDGAATSATFSKSQVAISLLNTAPGLHRLVLVASDYQELKNMENVPQILPNTRVYRSTFRVK